MSSSIFDVPRPMAAPLPPRPEESPIVTTAERSAPPREMTPAEAQVADPTTAGVKTFVRQRIQEGLRKQGLQGAGTPQGDIVTAPPPAGLPSTQTGQVSEFAAAVEQTIPNVDPNIAAGIKGVISRTRRQADEAKRQLKEASTELTNAVGEQTEAQMVLAQADIAVEEQAMLAMTQAADAGYIYELRRRKLDQQKQLLQKEHETQLEAQMTERRNANFSTFFNKKSTGAKIAMMLGIFLEGAGAAFNGRSGRAMEMLQGIVESDAQAIDEQTALMKEMHSRQIGRVDDTLASAHADLADKWAAIERETNMLIAKTKHEGSKARLIELTAGMKIKVAESKALYGQRMAEVTMSGGRLEGQLYGMLEDIEQTRISVATRQQDRADALTLPDYGTAQNRQQFDKAANYVETATPLVSALSDHVKNTFNVWAYLNPEDRAERLSQFKMIIPLFAAANKGVFGALHGHDIKIIEEIVGSGDIKDILGLKGRVQTLLENIDSKGAVIMKNSNMRWEGTPLGDMVRANTPRRGGGSSASGRLPGEIPLE